LAKNTGRTYHGETPISLTSAAQKTNAKIDGRSIMAKRIVVVHHANIITAGTERWPGFSRCG
jgi:hypothetical protein